jgi:hypothetical protein
VDEDQSDGQLLTATAEGDAEAFGGFYRRREQRILRYAIAHCANASDVADVVGETFLGAPRAAARFTDRELVQLIRGDELSPAQAGAVLGMNPHTARIRLSRARARARLRDALARAGVPAVVTVGSVCTVPGHPSGGLPQVISRSPASDGHSATTITPSAIPAGEELSIGYFAVRGGGLYLGLVPDNVPLMCTSTPPVPPHRGSGPPRWTGRADGRQAVPAWTAVVARVV